MRIILWAALACGLLGTPASAQTVNDLVQVWLAQAGKVAATGDYATCQPEGASDGICAWNAGKLGTQPSTSQLQALAPAWQTAQQAAQYVAIIKAGLAVTSSGTPSLSATYGVDQDAQLNIDSQIAAILTNGTFTNGQATRVWHDAAGLPHTFTVAQFKALATAIGVYVDGVIATVDALRSGSSAAWPTATTTIP